MTSVNELIAIVPVIFNLKGNIEMNLSARLGTASNMGDLDIPAVRNELILGNLALLQVQAAVVSFTAACFTFLLGMIIPGVGEESSDPLPTGTRDLFRHRHPQIAGQGHSLRRPRPTPPPAGVPRSGFNEYVSLVIVAFPYHPLTHCLMPSHTVQIHGAHIIRHVSYLPLLNSPGLVHVFSRRPLPKARS
jgi:solute carrier family 41